jgi:Effector-associated domain 11
MKHIEKLDLVLRALYKYRFSGENHSIYEILKEIGDNPSLDEDRLIGQRLENENLIKLTSTKDSVSCKINSYGIEYCERSSHIDASMSIINFNYDYLQVTLKSPIRKDHVRALVQKSLLEDAIHFLYNAYKDQIEPEILDALLGKLTRLRRDDIIGVISPDEKELRISKIASDILDLIKNL